MSQKSEFGKGTAYCLGLFLKHAEFKRYEQLTKLTGSDQTYMWFNGAADHLFDFDPSGFKDEFVRAKAELFQNKCLNWRLPFGPNWVTPTEDDIFEAIKTAEELLMEYDRQNDIKVEEAKYN